MIARGLAIACAHGTRSPRTQRLIYVLCCASGRSVAMQDPRYGDMSYKHLMRIRQRHREQDLAESQALLLELGTSEPTLQQCFKIIESTCLSQGIYCSINGRECQPDFQRHLDHYYVPFVKDCLRSIVIFGFIPWRVRRVRSGDWVPEVLAPGTFDWHTELGPSVQSSHQNASVRKRPLSLAHDDDTKLVVFRVLPVAGGVREQDVNVYMSSNPSLNVSVNSVMSSTVSSPLAHVLTDYKNLRNAQLRRSYADAWNTTAHIISTFRPTMRGQDDPTQYLMDFVHESHFSQPGMLGDPLYPALQAHNYFERDLMIRRQMDHPSTHRPQVYTLPRDHDVAEQVMLQPCEDMAFLLDKFRRDISALTGVPHEMIIGRDHGNHETVRKTIASGRIFSTNMHEFCRHCQNILRDAYSLIYNAKPDDVEFILTPMPRLEVETIQDFKVLFEIGALTPDMSLELSRIMLGSASRPKQRKNENQFADRNGTAKFDKGGGTDDRSADKSDGNKGDGNKSKKRRQGDVDLSGLS